MKVYYCAELDEIVVAAPYYGQPTFYPSKIRREFVNGGFIEYFVDHPMVQWRYEYIGEFD
jgi:hypothetical protein